ncbi:MAG: ATP-binding protein [Acidimicrobiales bacterium]
MSRNPFHFGSPVTGAHFAGRAAESRLLASLIADGANVVLTGPVGYGKTSLLLRMAALVEAEGGTVTYADLLRMSVAPESAARVIEDACGAPSTTRGPAVLVLDGLDAVPGPDEALSDALRRLGDRRPELAVVVSGTSRLRTADATWRPWPSAAATTHLSLGPIEEEVMVAFLRSCARAGGKSLGVETAAVVCGRAGPVPRHIQRLAHAAFEEADREVTPRSVEAGFRRVLALEAEHYERRISGLAAGYRRVLAALAAGAVEHPQSAAFVRATGYANPAAARKALRVLEDKDVVVEAGGGVLHIADPFFSAWVRGARTSARLATSASSSPHRAVPVR